MFKICIFGSCVSRDLLNEIDPALFELKLYAARSSFGSLFAAVPFVDRYSERLESAFQQRVVNMDIQKKAVARFRSVDPDVILIDLIDERFDMVQGPNGGRCTYSSEFRRTGFRFGNTYSRISSDSEEFFQHWTNGWLKFIDMLDTRGLRDAVLVSRSYYAASTISGVPFDSEMVAKANKKLERMYGVQSRYLHSNQFIEFDKPRRCPDDHRWAPSPFHYDQDSNQFAARRLQEFVAKRLESISPK